MKMPKDKIKKAANKTLKFEDLDLKLQLLLYVRTTLDSGPKSIFCIEDPKYFTAARELIAEGKIIEVNGCGGSSRGFVLSESEKRNK